MIFPVLFYNENELNANPFQDALRESLYTDQTWPGMACELSQIGDCIVGPQQFGVDIFPAYVFLRRLEDDAENAVMVKKIEGRELSTDEILQEIEDSYGAVFDEEEDGPIVDEDGDGKPDNVVGLPKQQYGLFGLGQSFGGLFNCGSFLPEWLCKLKLGHVLVLLIVVAVLSLLILKKVR